MQTIYKASETEGGKGNKEAKINSQNDNQGLRN